jgi:hypothetical protein
MKRTGVLKVWPIILIVLITGCKQGKISIKDYIKWKNDPSNNLISQKQVDDLSFKIDFLPLDYLILQNNHFQTIDTANYRISKKEMDGLLYFHLSVESISGNKSPLNHMGNPEENIAYLSFQLPKDFEMIIGQQSFPCVLHHFEQNYNLIPKLDILLGFEYPDFYSNHKIDKDITVKYNDQIFGAGLIEFNIRGEALSKIPKLKLK